MSSKVIPLARLGGELRGFGQFTRRVGARIVREYALDLWRYLVAISPVRTGRYRASHTVSVGTPVGVVLPDAATYSPPSETIPQDALAGYRGDVPAYVLNVARGKGSSTSYAPLLEPPTVKSPKAPEGVYAVAVPAVAAKEMTTLTRRAIALEGGEP